MYAECWMLVAGQRCALVFLWIAAFAVSYMQVYTVHFQVKGVPAGMRESPLARGSITVLRRATSSCAILDVLFHGPRVFPW